MFVQQHFYDSVLNATLWQDAKECVHTPKYVPVIKMLAIFPSITRPKASGGYNHSDRDVGFSIKLPKKEQCYSLWHVCFEVFVGKHTGARTATATADGPGSTSGNSWGRAHICSALGGNGETCWCVHSDLSLNIFTLWVFIFCCHRLNPTPAGFS